MSSRALYSFNVYIPVAVFTAILISLYNTSIELQNEILSSKLVELRKC